MKKNLVITAAILAVTTLFAFKSIESTNWEMDSAHSNLRFSINHLMVNDIEGNFTKFEAKITSSKEDLSDAVATMTATVASVNTGNEKRDGHLKTADFFDAEKYPTIIFKSSSFKPTGEGKYKIEGELTMHGVTKHITLDGVAKHGKNPMSQKDIIGVRISGTIKRSDFEIASKMPEMMLSNDVNIVANGEYVKM